MKTRTTGAVVAVLFLILAIFSPTAAHARGKDFGLQGDAAGLVYDFEVSPTRINHNDDFKVSLRFSGGQNEDENREGFIKPGSKIVVPITAGTGAQAAPKLLTPDLSYNGKKIADVDVTSSSISITFTRDVEKLHDVRGFLNVVMTGLNAERGTTRTLKVGNTTVSVAHNRGGDRGVFAGKTGLLYGDSNPGYVTWFLRANINGDSYPGGDVDIADVLGAGQQLDGHGIKIGLHWGGQHRSQYDLRWNSINDFLNDRNYGAYAGTTIDFNQNDGKIAIHIPESVINGKEFSFTYDAKIMDDTQEEFTNTATFDFYENQKKDRIVDTYTVRNPKASGGIEGKTTASLNLDKVLKDSRIPVPGVQFKIERQDKGALFPNKSETSKILTTNDKGQIREKGFRPGTLVITEVGAPEGIVFDPQKVTELKLAAGEHSTINKIENSVQKTEIKVTKAWADAEDRDHLRPRSVKIQLLADGKPVEGKVLTLPQNGKWEGFFTDLNAYKPGFTAKDKINYSVKELDVPSGYTPKVTGNQTTGFTVTNTHTPNTVGVEGVKTWEDANNQDGLRPASIQVQLLANGKPHGDPVEVKADEKGAWKYSFADLPKFAEGKQIVYSVAEVKVPEGYVSKADGMNLKNTHKPATVSVEGTKTWDDANNQDGKRPESITIRLLKNGVEADSRTVTAAQKWAWSFTDLPKFDKGQEIVYTITEDAVSGYSAKMSGYNVTNTYTPGKTSVGVAKSWQDGHDQDGLRPESVQVQLLADGKPVEGKVLTLKAANNWAGTFTELEEFKAGKKIAYSVAEVNVPKGYTSQVAGDATRGYTVTNTHTPAVTAIPVLKVWDDADNKDGLRPDSITVRLLANGKPVEGQSLTLTKDNAWKGQFAELPANKGGKPVEYSVVEDKVDGYTSKVESTDGVVKVTNTHTPKADAPALAFTGATVGGLAGAALLSLLTGMAFLLMNRRKKS
ncbi:Cna B-type domain-containing protein [Trueperella pyogenes]|uniref:Cna B-type domain-containing protein n=1 Tax=Trueperella pyogenes TaxID=1661 RepID=UPI00345D3411